jgi:hypothetical protein
VSSPINISQIIGNLLNVVLSVLPTIIQVAVVALAIKMLVSAFVPAKKS